jgi:hypothetical protein
MWISDIYIKMAEKQKLLQSKISMTWITRGRGTSCEIFRFVETRLTLNRVYTGVKLARGLAIEIGVLHTIEGCLKNEKFSLSTIVKIIIGVPTADKLGRSFTAKIFLCTLKWVRLPRQLMQHRDFRLFRSFCIPTYVNA